MLPPLRFRSRSALVAALLAAFPLSCTLPLRERDELDALDPTGGLRFPVPAPSTRDAPARRFDVEHIALDLEVDPASERIEGLLRLELRALEDGVEKIGLDLVGLAVHAVTDAGGRALAFAHRGGTLEIALAPALEEGESCAVRIAYGGRPPTGLYFGRDGRGRSQVFTHNQPEQARGWMPCVDAPDERQTLELRVRVPAELEVVSGGALVERAVSDELVRYTWRLEFPLPSYLVSFAAGAFARVERRGGERDLVLFCEPEDLVAATAAFASAPGIHDALTAWTGVVLPWPQVAYTLVRGLPVGGMENLGHVLLERERFLVDPAVEGLEDPADLLAHEAAHQWFGDLVSPRSWSDLWLSEGFASYLHLLWVEQARGVEAFQRCMRENRADARRRELETGPRALDFGACAHPLELFDARVYGGACARLHLLREQIGAESFRLACSAYLRELGGRSASTAEVLACFQRFAAEDLSAFFDAWFRHGGEPLFRVRWERNAVSGRIELTLAQEQLASPAIAEVYPCDLEVALGDASGVRRTVRVLVRERVSRVELDLDFEPVFALLDPAERALGTCAEPLAPSAALVLLVADEPARRFAGARALAALAPRDRDGESNGNGDGDRESAAADVVRVALEARLSDDASAEVRSEAALALARHSGFSALEPLRAALSDADARVRLAAARSIGSLEPDFGVAITLRRAWEAERNPLVRAELLLGLGLQRAAGLLGLIDLVLDDLKRSSLERRAALRALETLGSSARRSAPEILERIEPSLAAERAASERAAALLAFERTSRGDFHSRFRLERALRDAAAPVRRAAALALERRSDPAALFALVGAYRRESDPGVRIALASAGRVLNDLVDRAKQRLEPPSAARSAAVLPVGVGEHERFTGSM